ncbi:MAG: hypothetical protein V3T81_05240 [Thermoanaerobaculia bacterium]
MRSLKFGAALLAVVLVHVTAVRLLPTFPDYADLFLVLVVFNALDGDSLAGLLGGVSAGLVKDALSGGPFGLFGLIDTIIGYGTAYAAQRLVIQRATGVFLLFTLAAACQQVLLIGIALLLMLPEQAFSWVLVKVVTSGFLGVALLLANSRLRRQVESWRRSRRARIRFER